MKKKFAGAILGASSAVVDMAPFAISWITVLAKKGTEPGEAKLHPGSPVTL